MKPTFNSIRAAAGLALLALALPVVGAEDFKPLTLESSVLYLRLGGAGGLPGELPAVTLPATNTIGTILDLRFATTAEFTSRQSQAAACLQTNLPLAILINHDTCPAAVAWAASLRQRGLGLVFGAAAPGIEPDIVVPVAAADETVYFQHPYTNLTLRAEAAEAGAATNQLARGSNTPLPRLSEADLVRARRAGAADPEATAEATNAAPAKPVVRDPALARALDLIQGLAVVRAKHRY